MRRSLGIALLGNGGDNPTGNSSPLRRRSSLGVPAQRRVSTLGENDDEAERIARRRTQDQMETPQSASSLDKRRSLGLSHVAQMPALQISERIAQCIKLNAENKINVKNAFSLEIIDFMTFLIKKKDKEMSNLQVASTSLDVSAKIYGFRVDGVHTDILKMIGGLDKQDKKDSDGNDAPNETDVQEGGENNAEDQGAQKKKKKRAKRIILSTVDSLRGQVEVVNPITLMIGEGDSQTTDLLFQAMLPYHENGQISLNAYNDVIFDTVSEDEPLKSKEIEHQNITINAGLDISPSFNNFQFLGWSAENESIDEPSPQNESRYQFDLDASLPADDIPASHTNAFDVDDYHEDVNRFGGGPRRTENIVDLSSFIACSGPKNSFEYSYLHDSISSHIQWVGPLHWKVRPHRSLVGSRIMPPAACRDTGRKKKEITIDQKDDDERAVIAEKFLPGHTVRLNGRTAKVGWTEDKITYPKDEHYDSRNFCRFYFRPKLHFNFLKEKDLNTTHLSDEVGNYNYNNDHDVSNYCPDLQNDDYQTGDDNENGGANEFNSDGDPGVATQGSLTGENLVAAPKLTSKIFIPYSLRAKKIDMRQLKKCIWRSLTKSVSDNENEGIREMVEQEMIERVNGEKSFCTVYKELPKILSKANVEALSLPIAFVSLLHLSNEKNLEVTSSDDLSDLLVRQN